ncbi:VWA domain-containing protein [Paenisporosarcina cavernae]|uniref:VWA domain-containing protein n=1 Tax=Paenisporosarcina cavernae TaxID=2320858 RepID=A0A385YSX8_9BACL|nr:VWA domain-containing protein [Paenisporosarcina cavernae]AYC29087.1 VWA domain-containing protein [Paenisporosarcina cavernae]
MDLRLDFPIFLLLFIPIGVYLLFFGKKEIQNSNWKIKVLWAIRLIAMASLIFSLTMPYLLLPVKNQQIVFLVDSSASAKTTSSKMLSFIDDAIQAKSPNQSIAAYAFGNDFQTIRALSNDTSPLGKSELSIDESATDISNAFLLSNQLIDPTTATRFVLISDGLQTSGSVNERLQLMNLNHTSVDVIPVDPSLEKDVAITSFDTPTTSSQGEVQTIQVIMQSSEDTTGELVLSLNDKVLERKTVPLVEGRNAFTFQHTVAETGMLKYEVSFVGSKEAILENNQLTSMTMVEDAPRVLIAYSGENASPIASYLDGNAVVVETIQAKELPYDLTNYLPYDAIIFDNVPGYEVGESKMQVIEQAVKNFGVGFMMVGGDKSFGLGGYFQTPIERVLPVEMEVKGKDQLPSLGLILVMDRSGSMMGSKIELAKEAAARSVELLREEDTLGFIAFDDRPWTIVEPVKMTDKQEVMDKILSVSPGGGTEIYSSLEAAYEMIRSVDTQRKHIILLTDGMSATTNDYEALLSEGLEGKITLSSVAIGTDADKVLLEDLANFGSGRYYDVEDESTIPAILSRETVMLSRTFIEDNPFYPTFFGNKDWSTLFQEGIPQWNVYIATTAKPTAETILESEKKDPVLIQGRYGIGQTIAYTSDSTGAWSGDFARTNDWNMFWNRAVSNLLKDVNNIPYDISRNPDGTYTITDPSSDSSFLDVTAVTDNGEEIETLTEILAPGKHNVSMDAEPGLVFLHMENEKGESFQTGISIPYSDEYKIEPADTRLLEDIVSIGDGEMISKPEEAVRAFNKKSAQSKPIHQYLLWFALILFFLDITWRRFGLAMITSAFKSIFLSRKPVTETVTDERMESLKRLRKKVKR